MPQKARLEEKKKKKVQTELANVLVFKKDKKDKKKTLW